MLSATIGPTGTTSDPGGSLPPRHVDIIACILSQLHGKDVTTCKRIKFWDHTTCEIARLSPERLVALEDGLIPQVHSAELSYRLADKVEGPNRCISDLKRLPSAKVEQLTLVLSSPIDAEQDLVWPKFSKLKYLNLLIPPSMLERALEAVLGSLSQLEHLRIGINEENDMKPSLLDYTSKIAHANRSTIKRIMCGDSRQFFRCFLHEINLNQSAIALWKGIDDLSRSRFVVPLSGLRSSYHTVWNYVVHGWHDANTTEQVIQSAVDGS